MRSNSPARAARLSDRLAPRSTRKTRGSGVPLEIYVSTFAQIRVEPSGMTNDADIRVAKSIVDYIFRWMGKRFLSVEHQEEVGILSPEVRARTPRWRGTDRALISPRAGATIATSCWWLVAAERNRWGCFRGSLSTLLDAVARDRRGLPSVAARSIRTRRAT